MVLHLGHYYFRKPWYVIEPLETWQDLYRRSYWDTVALNKKRPGEGYQAEALNPQPLGGSRDSRNATRRIHR